MLTRLLPGRTERLFERFRRRGDAGALAEVFDRTAPELFGLAARLAPAPGWAQDLLQQTFLAAIESAESWDGARRLEPWLVGILVREARLMRRRERRTPEAERLAAAAEDDPARAAEEREFAAALTRALEALPPLYREVLALHLVAEKPAAEIAAELGRASGTVRVQIHRGLELLRKALPAGFAAAGALGVLEPRALADVRVRVLAASRGAALSPSTRAPLAGAAPVVLTGVLMKKLGLAALVALIAGTTLWLALDRGERVPEVAARDGRADAGERTLTAPSEEGADAAARGAGPAQLVQSTARTALEGSAIPVVGAELHGRLVEEDGRPVAGVSVARLELPPSLFELDLAAVLDGTRVEPRVIADTTRTDAEGRFRFDGARPCALHALGIDLGGRRGALRILDDGLARGARLDLGDIVLAAAREVSGRVLDAEGHSVAGARIMAFAQDSIPVDAIHNDLHRLRPSSHVVAVQRAWSKLDPALPAWMRADVIALPSWVLALSEHMPVPTAHTDAEGRFALDAPVGTGVLLVAPPNGMDLGRELQGAGNVSLGDLVLEPGRPLTCRVLDGSGAPLDGVEVIGAAFTDKAEVAVGERLAPTGAPGTYARSSGTFDAKAEVFAARADEGSPWTIAGPFLGGGPRTLTLEAPCTLTLDARDPRGNAVEGLELIFARADQLTWEELGFLGQWSRPRARLTRAEDGYRLTARVIRLELAGAAPRAELVLAPAAALDVRVVDAASRAPIAGAEVTLRLGQRGKYLLVERARSDADGRARLTPGDLTELSNVAQLVRAEHEGYALAGATLASGARELELALAPPARLVAEVHGRGGAPEARWLLSLQPADDALRNGGSVPWHALTDAHGRCELTELPAGRYRYDLGERFLAGDPLPALLSGRLAHAYDFDKGILERRAKSGTVELRAGETARLELDLDSEGAGEARLAGRIVRGGRGVRGLELELDVGRTTLVRTTDAGGAFDFGPVPAGSAYLKGEDHELDTTVLRLRFELAEGERRQLDLAFDPLTIDLGVVDGEGRPMAEVELELHPQSRLYAGASVEARTDGAGRARVTLPGCGSFQWRASLGARKGQGDLDVLSGDALTIVFQPKATCSGTVELPPELQAELEESGLYLSASSNALAKPIFGAIDRASGRFSLEGLEPGPLELSLICRTGDTRPVTLTIPPEGLVDQRIAFEVQR